MSSKARCLGNRNQYLPKTHQKSWCFVPQLNGTCILLFLGIARLITGCSTFNKLLLLLTRELADSSFKGEAEADVL